MRQLPLPRNINAIGKVGGTYSATIASIENVHVFSPAKWHMPLLDTVSAKMEIFYTGSLGSA